MLHWWVKTQFFPWHSIWVCKRKWSLVFRLLTLAQISGKFPWSMDHRTWWSQVATSHQSHGWFWTCIARKATHQTWAILQVKERLVSCSIHDNWWLYTSLWSLWDQHRADMDHSWTRSFPGFFLLDSSVDLESFLLHLRWQSRSDWRMLMDFWWPPRSQKLGTDGMLSWGQPSWGHRHDIPSVHNNLCVNWISL